MGDGSLVDACSTIAIQATRLPLEDVRTPEPGVALYAHATSTERFPHLHFRHPDPIVGKGEHKTKSL